MSKKGLLVTTLIIVSILLSPSFSFASKTTDIMSVALKHRSNGDINSAIKNFKKAVDEAPSLLQRNLALFMLGDCQMEANKYSDAIVSFTELSKNATTADERAEALYKIMEANFNLGNSDKVKEAFSQIKKKYPKTPYYKIAEAFIQAEKTEDYDFSDSVAVDESANEKTVVAKAENKTKNNSPTVKKDSKSVQNENKKGKPEPQTTKTQTKKATPTTTKVVQETPKTGKNLDSKTTALLEEIINIKPISQAEKDDLVSKILTYQDKLKDGEKGAGKDKILFELAGATAKFGELLEACKTYDKILSLHPTSPLVEDSYYQAIRLRAILGVHQAVIEWSKAFNATFPNSKYKEKINALISYSQAGGKVQLAKKTPNNNVSGKQSTKSKTKKSTPTNANIDSANKDLKASSLYKTASKKMNDGKYSSALDDLKVLASSYSNSPQLWWDMTLVYVQLEEFKQADKSIRKMLQLDPNNSDANSLLGYIQYRLENYDEAANAYEQAGESEGEGVTFFDAKTASERMKKASH
jgi:TolA-binding protein